jgi:hypothetical protein
LDSNEARHGGKPVDFYEEHLDVNQYPIVFVKDEVINHQLTIQQKVRFKKFDHIT